MRREVNQDLCRFLKRLREEEKVSLEKLSKGLMTASQLARIEKGERSICKNVRDRLIGRLGIASDLYENLLNIEDYAAWELQRDILHAVEQRDLLRAQELLVLYETQKTKSVGDKIKKQFCLVMQAEILKQQGVASCEIGDCYERAVKLTVPDVNHLCFMQRLLSIQEVNMILEYEFYHEDVDFADKCRDLMTFVENSVFDDLSKVKIYPKIVYYYLRVLFNGQNRQDVGSLEKGMEICNRAIEMLRDAGRAYYLLELLEMKIKLIKCIEDNLDEEGKEQKWETFKTDLQDCAGLMDLLKNLYAQYEVPAYMPDCTYLYQQRWMFYVGDVLRIRRNMFGLSQKRLCSGVCSVKSLRRAEKKESNMQQAALGILLGRLGLSKEFQRARLISNDREVLKLKEEMAECRNNYKLEQAREILRQIKARVSDEIPGNLQFFIEAEAALDWAEGKIAREEFQAREEEALCCTLKVKNLYQIEEVYLTEMELACIRKIQQVMKGEEKRESIDFVLRFFEMYERKNALADSISMYEFAIINAICELGNLQEYQLSTKLAKKVLREDLQCRRIWGIEGYLYEIAWNEREQHIKDKQTKEKEKMTETLKQCLMLSHFCNQTFYEDFYYKKMGHE
ncbi:MAG: helix-turn-helix transcriptional regulator [Lachnospiraceae bacterium]|nr:helix-turn-helix transcriptional regulator [Lachnospiraceae bacterium]